MKKHAYIIMAHDNFYCLEKLIKLLDDPRNDIFLHIDSKVQNFNFDYFRDLCQNAGLVYPAKRINVRWGTQSQVMTEMLMLRTAADHGNYQYYHILSGADLPLRSQDAIHRWFEEKTESYLYYSNTVSKWDVQRISRYHFRVDKGNPIAVKLNGICNRLQDWMKVDRTKNIGLVVQKGSNWASLTQEAVELLLRYEALIRKMTRFSVCADEVYKQTILLHHQLPIVCNDLRLVVWGTENHPHTYVTDDYELLCNSDRLFARKFSEKVDRQIIDLIDTKVRSESQCPIK